jgi:hypothetical protein
VRLCLASRVLWFWTDGLVCCSIGVLVFCVLWFWTGGVVLVLACLLTARVGLVWAAWIGLGSAMSMMSEGGTADVVVAVHPCCRCFSSQLSIIDQCLRR